MTAGWLLPVRRLVVLSGLVLLTGATAWAQTPADRPWACTGSRDERRRFGGAAAPGCEAHASGHAHRDRPT
jgi:hypothetical protein